MHRLYLVSRSYSPNDASSIRMMGWVRGLSELGIDAEYVFFSPSDCFDKVQQSFPHIKFTYLWERCYFKNSVFRYASLAFYVAYFVLRLKSGDTVYIYSFPELLKWVEKRSGVRVYDEVTECPDVSLVGSRFYKPNVDKFIRDCKKLSGLFVISQNLKDYFVGKGIPSEMIHLVNMTVDISRFNSLKKQAVEPYIVYCGSATNKKDGVDQLIQAFKIVSERHPNVKLYIIGPKPEDGNVNDNLLLTRNLDIEDKVVFTGSIPSDQIPQMLKNATICALARPNNIQAKYGFPTKLGEYLLSENPVVITRVGNIPDFLEDGVSALIAEPGNPRSFAEKLCWCLGHPVEAQIIGKRGAEVAKIRFSNITETKKIAKILGLK